MSHPITYRFWSMIAALLLASPTLASTEPETDALIVTASRTEEAANATLAPVTVITRADIERSQARSVQDLLANQPGISVANNGGAGKFTAVYMRGTNAGHVLVLIDGVKVGSATSGTTSFQDIPLEEIERIEIVRGPRSSLYGSEAIGGVIQIFTRKGKAGQYASIGVGSRQSYQGSAGLSQRGEKGWFNISASHENTQGINTCQGSLSGGCYNIEPDFDGYRNSSASWRGGYRLHKHVEFEGNGLSTTGNTEFDGSFVNNSDFNQRVIGGKVRLFPDQISGLTLAAGQSWDQSDNFLNRELKSIFDTRRDSVSLQGDVALSAGHLLSVGADHQNDVVSSDTAYDETSRSNDGLFGQYRGQLGSRNSVQFSLRNDDNEQFGTHATGGAGWGFAFTESLRLALNYGTGFKAPTFNDLYYPGYSNPDLTPEQSESVDLGVNGHHGWGRWSVNVFKTRIDDLINLDATYTPYNLANARIRGIETAIAAPLGKATVSGNLTLQDPENLTEGANEGNTLSRRPQAMGRLEMDYPIRSAYRVGTTLNAQGKRYNDDANIDELGGFATVDLRAEWLFSPQWRLQGRLANLLDKEYETVAFYNQTGQSVFLTLRYQN